MQRKTVLVAEPDARLRATLRNGIERLGLTVAEAGDGASALRAASRTEVALLVADLYLPCGDDKCLIHALGRAPSLRRTKMLVLTSHASTEDRDWARRAGADAFLEKGQSPDEVLRTIARLASSHSPARRTPRAAADALTASRT